MNKRCFKRKENVIRRILKDFEGKLSLIMHGKRKIEKKIKIANKSLHSLSFQVKFHSSCIKKKELQKGKKQSKLAFISNPICMKKERSEMYNMTFGLSNIFNHIIQSIFFHANMIWNES